MYRAPTNRRVAAVFLCAAALAGCTSSDQEPTETTQPLTSEIAATTTAAPVNTNQRNDGDGRLVLGAMLPDEGPNAAAGQSAAIGADLAVTDVNSAGGVLLEEIFLSPGTSGTTANDVQATVDRHLREGIDIILDGAPVDQSIEALAKTNAAGVVQFSPTSSATELAGADNAALYFRTAPSDTERAVVLANLANEQSLQTMAVVFDDTGAGPVLAEAFVNQFQGLGGEVTRQLPYSPGDDFSASTEVLSGDPPSGIVVIGGPELADFITEITAVGIGPRSIAVYAILTEDASLGELVEDPRVLNGLGVVERGIDIDRIETFVSRVEDAASNQNIEVDFDYNSAAAGYDAVIISALATEIAGTDRPEAIAEQIIGVTREGVLCVRYNECLELVQSGENINYDGLSGPLEFVPPGEPSAAGFVIRSYDGNVQPNEALDRYLFAR